MSATETVSATETRDGYTGPATVEAGETVVPCEVTITGFFEPVTGRYKWYGRARGEGLDALPSKGSRLRTPHGSAETTVADVDPWDRYRLQGFGSPPFPVPGPVPGARPRPPHAT